MTHIVLAMPHRGRLSLLTGLLGYDLAAVFHKINGGAEVLVDGGQINGDILYHQGMLNPGMKITLILTVSLVSGIPNTDVRWKRHQSISFTEPFPPWYVLWCINLFLSLKSALLEFINPVALGKTRAKQHSLLKGLEKGEESMEGCTLGDKVSVLQVLCMLVAWHVLRWCAFSFTETQALLDRVSWWRASDAVRCFFLPEPTAMSDFQLQLSVYLNR